MAAIPAIVLTRQPPSGRDLTDLTDQLTFSYVLTDGRSSLDQATLDSWLALSDVPHPD